MAPTQMKLRVRRRASVAGDAAAAGSQPEERRRPGGARSSRRKSSSRASATAASPPPPGGSSGAEHAGVMAAEDASPDSKCPICLDRFNNLAYLDRCLHRFCFPCIQEWSHNKAECPLCKQPFASILHSVRAEDDFKEYTLQPAPPNSSVAATVAMVAAMASAASSNHRMRLMLRRHRGVEALGGRRRREHRGRPRAGSGTGERLAVGEWYLDSPLSLPPHPAASPVLTDDSEEAEDLDEQRLSQGAASPDGGVIFEGMMRLGGAVLPLASTHRDCRRMMSQLAARRRMQQEGGPARPARERETLAFRRDLYRCGVRVRGVPMVSIQGQQPPPQQQQDISAEGFRRNPELLNRLRPWLRRELAVLYGAHGSLVDIIQRIIMARLARHGLEDTPTIEDELRPFLLARTEHFLHELLTFARSPLSLESYDLQAVYEPPAATTQLEAISSSSDRESIIAISEGEEEQGLLGGDQDRAGGADVIQSRSSLSQSAWDDETPGPSYSAAEPSCSLSSLSFSPTQHEAANEEDGQKEEEEEEECLIVGYKKPIAERTPELVQLSSDSEEEEEEEEQKREEDQLAVSPSTTPPLLRLPIIPPSTSGTNPKEQEEEELEEKGGEVCEQTFCSGRSRKSRCGPQQQQQHGEEGSGEERRGQRNAREQARRRSGTLFSPNRCIYPAMMRRRSRSSAPFQSSAESSPPDSSWEDSCSQVSRRASSGSSPSRLSWSSSPPRSPPHLSERSPPPPSAPPCERGEKPGGKRKYKSRHLDSASEEPSWKQRRSSHRRERRRERKKKERRRRRPRQDGRRAERAQRAGGSRRSREERSPSVEIIYEAPVGSNAPQPPAHKRRRKPEQRTQPGRCPIIITLDSDGSQDGVPAGPPAASQTLDVSELLPLLLPQGGELPVEILNQGFHGLDREPPRSDHDVDVDVDVETVEGHGFRLGSEEGQRSEVCSSSQAAVSDGGLLMSILGDLQVVTQPKWSCGRPATQSPMANHGTEGSRPLPELPPLLRQVSPVRSYSRNTPPPLRRSDAPSPRPARDCAAEPAACTTNHKPSSAPGPASQRACSRGSCSSPSAGQQAADLQAAASDGPSAPSQSTSAERSSSAEDTPPGLDGSSGVNHSHKFLEDFVPSGQCGPDSHRSPAAGAAPARVCPTASSVLITPTKGGSFSSDFSCRSSQIRSSAAAGAALDNDAPSLGPEEPSGAHPQSTLWKCGASGPAPPGVRHPAFPSSASSGESQLSAAACSDLLADSQESQPPVGSH